LHGGTLKQRKVQERSPLKYATVRQMECLDPSLMFRDSNEMSHTDISEGQAADMGCICW